MRGYAFWGIFLILLPGLQSCCSKKNQCAVDPEINSFELVNFPVAAATDSIALCTYARSTGFATAIDTVYLKGTATADTNICTLSVSSLDLANDYSIYIVKMGKRYTIGSFTAARKDCSKCFMRSSNRIGQELNGYAVNGFHLPYEGKFRIYK